VVASAGKGREFEGPEIRSFRTRMELRNARLLVSRNDRYGISASD
jgi:hypothetical protein